MMGKTSAVFSCFVMAVSSATALAATWYVSPAGSDETGDGSAEKPVATIPRAVELSRCAAHGEKREIVVADGEYAVADTILMEKRDSGLVIRAAKKGKTLLSGSAKVMGWEKDVSDGRFLVADFPFDINPNAVYSLVVNGKPASLALFPAKGLKPLPYFASSEEVSSANHTVLRYDRKALSSSDTFKQLDLASVRVVIPQEWAKNRMFIATNDWQNGVFHLKGRTNMPLGRFNQGYRISNSRQGLTEPGTWMYEGSTGKIRYWPRKGETAKSLDASVTRLQSIFRLLADTKNVTISGFVIEGCAKLPGAGLYAKSGAAAAITGHKPVGVKIVDCVIRYCAGSGVCFSKPRNCEVSRCVLHDLGVHGVHYADGGLGGGVFDCEIFRPGSSGAYLQLPGVSLVGNHIHHTGRSAATLWTTGGVVVSNELDHTMLSSRDGGAIYGAMNDSLFEGNYCHDSGDWPGLYNDEGGRNTVYRGNRFERCWWPIHMHDCRNIVVTNNLMACDKPMRFSFQGSANCVFRDNLVRAPKKIDSDPYVGNCAVWENIVETGSFKSGWKRQGVVKLTKGIAPPKSPRIALFVPKAADAEAKAFEAKDIPFPWKNRGVIDRDETGRESPGCPGGAVFFAWDEVNLYVKALYEYNKFMNYKGARTIGPGPWGMSDGLKFVFEGFDVTVFLDGTVVSSDPSLKFGPENLVVKSHGGCGAGGWSMRFAVPLAKFRLDGKKIGALVGRKIPFDTVFYNVEYDETRYYEGPSKGDRTAGSIILLEKQPDAARK